MICESLLFKLILPEEASADKAEGTALAGKVFETPVEVVPDTEAFPDVATVPFVPTPAFPLISAFPDIAIAPFAAELVSTVPLALMLAPP